MLVEIFPRLSVQMRAIFPDAKFTLEHAAREMSAHFPNFPDWKVLMRTHDLEDHQNQFQLIETQICLDEDALQNLSEHDLLSFVAAENSGLRGATVTSEKMNGRVLLFVRTSFLAQKGRTRDEAENLAIDLTSVLRFCKILKDRIVRSTAGYDFSFEMYNSIYLHKSSGLARYANYARHVFTGSAERVFKQTLDILENDYLGRHHRLEESFTAQIELPSLALSLRLPSEVPTMSAVASFDPLAHGKLQILRLTNQLNGQIREGHFEIAGHGKKVSYVAWKHLTNDLRLYSFDHLVMNMYRASELLNQKQNQQPGQKVDFRSAA